MYHHMELDPGLIRERNQQFQRGASTDPESGCGRTTRCTARDWLLSPFASRTHYICFAGWGLQDASSVRIRRGSAQS